MSQWQTFTGRHPEIADDVDIVFQTRVRPHNNIGRRALGAQK